MPYAIAAAAIGVGGSLLSSSTSAGASEDAAGDQEQAALAQLALSGNIFNAQSGLSLPTREAGGLAQSREAWLLGLTPDLDISSDFSSPYIQTNGASGSSLSWNGPAAGNPALNPGGYNAYGGIGPGAAAGSPAASAGYMYPTGATASGPGAFSLAGGGYSVVNPATAAAASASGTAGYNPFAQQFSAVKGGGVTGGYSGTPNPNAGLPASSYGSFANPYNPSTFYQDPGYNFILSQNENQISNQQAATGQALSPAALTASLQYSSGLASQEFNNAYNRSMNTQTTELNELNALSSGGQIATGQVSSAAGQLGAAGASALAGYGNAGAAGAIGVGNAYTSAINGSTNAALNAYNNSIYGNSNGGGNPYNLGGSSVQAPAGYNLTYDNNGNITGSVPISS